MTPLESGLGSSVLTLWTVLGFGFMLGLRHATDADHVVAVSTIVSRAQTLRSAVLVAMLWGLGHTVTILLVGGSIVIFNLVISPSLETVLELCVATMLLVLGALNLHGAVFEGRRARSRDGARTGALTSGLPTSLRPLFVGIVHGLAGSAAIALLVLATIHDAVRAVLYLGVFGVGTIAGMALLTLLVVVPVAAATRRFVSIERYLAGATGAASLVFGVLLALRATLGENMPW